MKFVPNAISRTVAQQAFKASANSPRLLFVAGTIGMVGSTVLACRATLKLQTTFEKAAHDLEIARSVEYESDREQRKDVAIIYSRNVGSVARLYAPAILLGTASIYALTKSHSILQERNLALTAAYAAVDEAFKNYRAKVIDKYGEDVDREMRYELEDAIVVDPDTGKDVEVLRAAPGSESMYAKFFDEYCGGWSKEPEYNRVYLQTKQNYWNDILMRRGHVFLNEVYNDLGMDHTRAGAMVGWIWQGNGDNYIDFGIFDDASNPRVRDFVNGREGSILLDFNVDGPIVNDIKDPGERLSWQN